VNIGVLTLELYLPISVSLKDKRKVLQSLQRRLRNHHNLAIAEVGHQELWQRASLAIVSVASRRDMLERLFDSVLSETERSIPGEIVGAEREFFN